MIDLNTQTLNGCDILSLIATQAAPAVSTESSTSNAADFSAMLTEMIGPTVAPVAAPVTTPAESTNASALITPDLSANLGTPVPTPTPEPTAGIPVQLQPAITPTALPELPQLSQMPSLAVVKVPVANAPVPAQQVKPADLSAEISQLEALTPQAPEAPEEAQEAVPEQTQAPKAPGKSEETQKPQDVTALQPNPVLVINFAPLVVPQVMTGQMENPITTPDVKADQASTTAQQKLTDPNTASAPVTLPAALQIELQRAGTDVKKFEITVQNEIAQPARTAAHAQPATEDLASLPVVTTDPIANIQIQQLPPRITAIEKLVPETTLPQRTKTAAVVASDTAATPAVEPGMRFSEVQPQMAQVEQARPAHQVEIPQPPHVQVVRAVSMEVGDPGSQVTVRIQERAGDISMQINTTNEPLHQELQSSVASLLQALKQEQVQVSNVDVSKKSPIEKVRRMKEAN